MNRRSLAVATVSVALVLPVVGCSSDEPPQASVSWSDDVCSAFAELDTAVKGLGEDIPPIDPASASSIGGAIDVLRAQVRQIRSSADNLRTAIDTDLPPEASEGLDGLRDQAASSADDARAAVGNVGTALTELIKSPTSANLTSLKDAVSASQADLDAIGDELQQATSDAQSELSKTLRAAPACAPYLPPES